MSEGMLNEKCEIDIRILYYICGGNESKWCQSQKLFLSACVKIGK